MTYSPEDMERIKAASNIIVPLYESDTERWEAMSVFTLKAVRAGSSVSEIEAQADAIAREEYPYIQRDLQSGEMVIWQDRGVVQWFRKRNLKADGVFV